MSDIKILDCKDGLAQFENATIRKIIIDDDRLKIILYDGRILDIWNTPKPRWRIYEEKETN